MNDCDALRFAIGQAMPYNSSCCSSCHEDWDLEGMGFEPGDEEYKGKTYWVCCRVSEDFEKFMDLKKPESERKYCISCKGDGRIPYPNLTGNGVGGDKCQFCEGTGHRKQKV